MNNPARARAALWGAMRLLRFDRGGLTGFDASREGFVHSFYAVALAAPLFLLVISLENMMLARAGGSGYSLVWALLSYGVRWAGFIAIAYGFARMLQREAEFAGFVTAFNWAKPLFLVVLLPLVGLGAAGAIGAEAYGGLGLILRLYLAAVQVFLIFAAFRLALFEAAAIFIVKYFYDTLIKLMFRAAGAA